MLVRLADRIDALLPQTQCTKCGFEGCRPYADAIAGGEADINQCPPGGAAGIAALSQLLGREAPPLNPANGVERPLMVCGDRRDSMHRLHAGAFPLARSTRLSAVRSEAFGIASQCKPACDCACRRVRWMASRWCVSARAPVDRDRSERGARTIRARPRAADRRIPAAGAARSARRHSTAARSHAPHSGVMPRID